MRMGQINSDFPIIKISSLTKYYGKQLGVEDVDLEIKKGEVFGFLGQNGSGKTTTIRCILSILLPTNGAIFLNGELVTRDNPELKEYIGYLPGELNIPGHYKVSDFIDYIATLRKSDSSSFMDIVKRFDVPLDKKFAQLSKGNKQKVGIVLAFMSDPEILILDEPTSGLDPLFQLELYKLIEQEKQKGKTIFFSSHNLDEVQRICDRVAIIREGKIVTIETVKELAVKVPRKLKAKVTDPNHKDLDQFMELITLRDAESHEVHFNLSNGNSLSKILEALTKIGVDDISYPPASLEEYFMSKYATEG